MYEFTCPKCRTSSTAPSLKNGCFASCLHCGQRVQILLMDGADFSMVSSELGPSLKRAAPPAEPRSPWLLIAGASFAGLTMAGGIVLAWLLLGRPPRAMSQEAGTGATATEPTSRTPTATGMSALRAQLNSKDSGLRVWACLRLAALGTKATPASADLMKILRKQDEPAEVVEAATTALAAMGDPPAEEIPMLIEALQDPGSSRARSYAAGVLGRVGAPAAPAIPALIKALQANDPEVRIAAVSALSKLGAVVRERRNDIFKALLPLVKDESSGIREAGRKGLENLGPTMPTDLPALKALLAERTGPKDGRVYAVRALGQLGMDGVPLLVEAMTSDPDAEVVSLALRELADMKAGSPPVVKALGQAMQHPERTVRLEAATVLTSKPVDEDTLPTLLVGFCNEEDRQVRAVIEKALPPMTTFDKKSIKVKLPASSGAELKVGLSNARAPVRRAVAYLLGQMGKDAPEAAIAELCAVLPKETNADAQLEMLVAVGEIGPPAKQAMPTLLELIKDKDKKPKPEYLCAAMALLATGASEADQKVAYGLLARGLVLEARFNRGIYDEEIFERNKKVLAMGGKVSAGLLASAYRTTFVGPDLEKRNSRVACMNVLRAMGKEAATLEVKRLMTEVLRFANNDSAEVIQATREAYVAVFGK